IPEFKLPFGYRFKKLIMLCLIGVVFGFAVKLVQYLSFVVHNVGCACKYFSFGAYQQFIHLAHRFRLVAALAVEDGAIGVMKFHEMMIEYFAIIFSLPHFSSADTLGF